MKTKIKLEHPLISKDNKTQYSYFVVFQQLTVIYCSPRYLPLFLLPLFDHKSRGKPNGKFTAVNNFYV